FSRREFLGKTISTGVAVSAVPFIKKSSIYGKQSSKKYRIALIGTGSRGTGMWGANLIHDWSDCVELVGLCDPNKKRVEIAKGIIRTNAPTFTDFDEMMKTTKPDMLIVTTVDATHYKYITGGMEYGSDIITEKPMATDEEQCQAIIDAQKKTRKKIIVTFNYRYGAVHEKAKEVLLSGDIGRITSLDFHWYLDINHGADYFRRWHAFKEKSGSLFVHKATHHFDLVNWWLDAEPVDVFAYGELHKYGKNGSFRGKNCRTCRYKDKCDFYWDITTNKRYMDIYVKAESEDGYLRDGCVYRNEINIWDTMTVLVKYNSDVQMSYSLNAFMPYEGYKVSFNGTKGRLDVRMWERQPWDEPRLGEIRVTKNFGNSRVINIPHATGGHGGGDPKLKDMIFKSNIPDPLNQAAGLRGGAMSILTGIAARHSVEENRHVRISELVKF
ncbi:Gfo/Idh/MocA family protein, partial [candidate division KSB1 bacterium]